MERTRKIWIISLIFVYLSYSLNTQPKVWLRDGSPTGAYIHIPFCRKRCHYCDFSVKVIGDRSSRHTSESEAYGKLLERDMELSFIKYKHDRRAPLNTVYFGGGTPSLYSLKCFESTLDKINKQYGISNDAEITVEMDPGTFDKEKLLSLKSLGVNRVSLGIQSFNDELLVKCGRAHRNIDNTRAISDIHAADIDNFSIDLISALPYLKADTWLETITKAVEAKCSHISVYDLQVEDGTAFGKWYTPGIFPLPSEPEAWEMYSVAVKELCSSGFEHYEISNYAQIGKRSKHNQKYWRCENTYGFGMAAASLINGTRFIRPKSLGLYSKWLDELECLQPSDRLWNEDQGIEIVDAMEVVMLALRTSEGLDFNSFVLEFGESALLHVWEVSKKYVKSGHVQIVRDSRRLFRLPAPIPIDVSGIRLTDPNGFLLSNEVISSMFAGMPS